MFHTTDYKLYNPNVTQNIKICIISDLHFSYMITDSKLDIMFQYLKSINPNYIFIVGDLIDSVDMIMDKSEENRIINWIKKIGSISPTLISLGSHDFSKKTHDKQNGEWEYYFDKEFFEKMNNMNNIYVLNDSCYENDNIYVMGLTQSFEYYANKNTDNNEENKEVMLYGIRNLNPNLITKLSEDKIKFALIHSPVYLNDIEIKNELKEFNYFISGHMHNGCVPPIIYELWKSTRGFIAPNKKLFPKNERNTLINKGDKLIVNGPITMFQECTGILQKLNILFPMYTSTIEFTNDKKYEQEKIYTKKYYTRIK